jgi:hypothetical protein
MTTSSTGSIDTPTSFSYRTTGAPAHAIVYAYEY